jgi:hypothetical protein
MQPLPTAGPQSIEHELADQLGLDVTAFVETFGVGWFEAEVMHDFDADRPASSRTSWPCDAPACSSAATAEA